MSSRKGVRVLVEGSLEEIEDIDAELELEELLDEELETEELELEELVEVREKLERQLEWVREQIKLKLEEHTDGE